MDRLFVPLLSGPFEDFKINGKQYEVRAYGRKFNEKHVYRGRTVELRKGYSGERLWGIIGNVHIKTLDDILNEIDFHLIEPRAKTKEDAKRECFLMITNSLFQDNYIVFQVKLCSEEEALKNAEGKQLGLFRN